MIKFGYSLSSEEMPPKDLVRYARRAEEAGFGFALISDHYHPWIKRQGQSPFVWSVIGAISEATQRLELGTGVTCPILRIHPAIIAQAAATAARMMPGRFFLGLGTGENLNEHILGKHWPPIQVRQEMLKEAVKILRLLWRGGNQSYRGKILYRRERADLHSAGHATADHDRCLRDPVSGTRRLNRRRSHQHDGQREFGQEISGVR